MLSLNFPEDSLPARLLEQHKARYFAWADTLSKPLSGLARERSTITGQPGSDPFEGPASINPLIACVPWLFWEKFSSMPEDLFLRIAEAGACLTLASGVIDHLVDGQYPDPALKTIFYASLINRGGSLYREIFPGDSPFWAQFDRLTALYLASLTAEIETQESLQRFDYAHFCWFAGGKVSPMSLTIAALAEASGQPELLDPIERSLNKSYVAGQLLDDVLDWKKDALNRHVTYVLTWIASGIPTGAPEWPEPADLERENRREWVDIDALKLSIREFDAALQAVENVDCPAWKAYLEEYRTIARSYWDEALMAHLHSLKAPVS